MPPTNHRVRVPGSSANLGSGFDALGLAVSLHLEVSAAGAPAPEGHPAVVAFRRAGGKGPLSVSGDIPPERGLGYSGAARVAGALAAGASRDKALELAVELEGHPDNAAPSLLGGLVVTAGGRSVRVPLAVDAAVVAWVPPRRTSTDASRAALPRQVPLADAAFNVGRAALLVAALASGDVAALRTATEDRLHQPTRLRRQPESAAAIAAAIEGGAWGAWLSGSGPTVAALCAPEEAEAVAAALPPGGEARVLQIDTAGAVVSRD